MGDYKAYLASGWFNAYQRECLENMRCYLSTARVSAYDPEIMCECPPDASEHFATYVLNENIAQIKAADFVYASIAGRDLGTLFEVGVAAALGKPVVYYDGDCNALTLASANFETETMLRFSGIAVVVDTTDKDPVSIATAGYAYAKGLRVLYYAPGLPEGAQFNLMLAKSGVAVCTNSEDLAACLDSLDQDSSWKRPYAGLIE
jgi:nucleoside 2-deoxyribosyltransferase